MQSLHNKYHSLPTNSLEFGGILCGYKENENNIITRTIDIPSLMGKKDSYQFDKNIVKSNICSPQKFLGMWHTHPEFSPFPSDADRFVSEKMNAIGCVLTDTIKCFKGDKDISYHII